MKYSLRRKAMSIFLAVIIAVSGIIPAFNAFAGDGVEGYYDIQIFYDETGTIVPSYGEDGESEYIEYMYEGETRQFKYELIDSEFPDNGYVKWYSENPVLVDTDQTGKVKAFDASKGAVIQSWIDNEVKTIPLLGKPLGAILEKAFFNDKVNLDKMDTEEIVNILIAALGSDSWIAGKIEAYQGQLVDSLRRYLDNINSNIHCQLFSADGTLLDEDVIRITVLKSEEWYAELLPNGTHITNKSQINTTQAVGNTVQLYAITTPQRLGFGTVYSVKSSSIFDSGKVVATVDDSGLVTFKNPGKVTILVSPDSEQVIEALLEFINKFYELQNTGTLDTDKIAKILIEYMGLDINRTVLAGILDACFAIYDIAQGTQDPVQLTATAVEVLANIILQMAYNDTITFNVQEATPLTDFKIDGVNSVKEGDQIQLKITDIQPETGNTGDITWSSSAPEIASVDPKTGIITGLDAGGSLGSLSSQTCTITATSAANNISKSVTITVTGKTGKYISSAEIKGPSIVETNTVTNLSYSVYPKRVAESDNLYITWGIQKDLDEDGNPVYEWASDDAPASDVAGSIDSTGHYTALDGGVCTIALKATTGYYLSNGNFYEISSFIATKDISTGIPVESIKIKAVDGTSNGELNRDVTVNINGTDYEYVTIHKGVGEGYYNNGAILNAEVYPENATNKKVRWVVDNGYYNTERSEDTHTLTVRQKANHEVADTFNVYAVTEDGEVVSNVITVCITRNYATENVIDQDTINLVNYGTGEATHTVSFEGSWTGTAYACYKCNWYSSDESIFTVEAKTNDNRDAKLTAHDVGTATLYCVSADGGIVDTAKVVVRPDKTYLRNIVELCENTVIIRTAENKKLYQNYMRKLDLAYAVLYDQDMASQTACDTYAQELLSAFYKLGGFVGIGKVNILATGKAELQSDHVTVSVGSVSNYKNYSYDFDYEISPDNAMYENIEWSSSNSSISVDKNGKCTPTSNDPCSAVITCTVTDYMGNQVSDSVYIAFARTKATGVTLDTTEIVNAKVGETKQLKATVAPTSVTGSSNASCQDVVWTSSDETVATVDQNGLVKYKYGGDCTITCTTIDGGYTAVCSVNVVTNYDPLQMLINQYTDLKLNPVNYYPDTWDTFTAAMQEAQAMIDRGGYSQKEVDAMYAVLENSYISLKKYNYIQKVELYLDGEATKEFYQYDLSLLKEGISYKNAVLDLNVRLYPNNASYKEAKWESSTSNISVTTDGKCSPTIEDSCYGMVTCTVTDHFGNSFSDNVWVSFAYYPVTALVLSETNISGSVGGTYQLACTVEPTGTPLVHLGAASIQDYYWESDDESVATVDETGLVTFVNAGSTVIRAVSYDGGVSAECTVSTEGDRSALKAALEKYQDIDYTQYDYDYGQTFRRAYENAQDALTNLALRQEEIDEAAANLNQAGEDLLQHPYISVESIDLNYTSYKKPLVGSASQVASGTVSSNDSLSINLSSSYSNYNNYNYVTINATPLPSSCMYKSIAWETIDSKDMDISFSNNNITLTPKNRDSGGWACMRITTTDHYSRTTSRTINVVMADKVCNGVNITETEKTLYASSGAYQLNYSVSGGPDFTKINWTSSDESVAAVDSNGAVTPIEKGTAVITAKTIDGGFTDTVKITVLTDFSTLAEKVDEYTTLINNVKDSYEYTEESLNVLSAAVAESKIVVDEGKATQAEVDAQLKKINDAYNALVRYEPVTGLNITYDKDQANVTEPNDGFIRYTSATLNSRTVQLDAGLQPAGGMYKSIEWTSSNENITIDKYGLATSKTPQAKYAVITCTVTNVYDQTFTDSIYLSFVRYGVTQITFDSDKVFGAPQEVKNVSPNLNQGSLIQSSKINDCLYTSSDESVATVDSEGNITFISQGSSTITVTSVDGGFTGTVEAVTTWDTTALQEAINQAKNINYTDYAYAQGTAFKNAYENAQTVYANVYATQDEIDNACAALQTSITNLEGNEFIAPAPVMNAGSEELADGRSYETDGNSALILSYTMNEGAMVKSAQWQTENENGVTTAVNGNNLVVTKTSDASASLTVKLIVTDDYDREKVYTYSIGVVDSIVNITSISITVNGVVKDETYVESGHSALYRDFTPLQLEYIATPEGATQPASVTWESSAPRYITVDENGVVNLTEAAKIRSSNTATIKCTVTNADGSVVTQTIMITISR